MMKFSSVGFTDPGPDAPFLGLHFLVAGTWTDSFLHCIICVCPLAYCSIRHGRQEVLPVLASSDVKTHGSLLRAALDL